MYGTVICAISCMLFISTIFWMRSARKWFKKQIRILERKKKELDELVMSATDMVHELNNVSDYVVTEVDKKSIEINQVMSEIDLKIEECRNLFEGKSAGNIVEFPKEVIDIKQVKVSPVKDKKSEIKKLFGDGRAVSDIAKELGVGQGEVQLILGITERYMELAN